MAPPPAAMNGLPVDGGRVETGETTIPYQLALAVAQGACPLSRDTSCCAAGCSLHHTATNAAAQWWQAGS
jgi:hypothetical protein